MRSVVAATRCVFQQSSNWGCSVHTKSIHCRAGSSNLWMSLVGRAHWVPLVPFLPVGARIWWLSRGRLYRAHQRVTALSPPISVMQPGPVWPRPPALRGRSALASDAPQRWCNGDLADDNRAEAGQPLARDRFLFGFWEGHEK